jgi:hypothetical protein
MIGRMWPLAEGDSDLEDLAYYLLEFYQNRGVPVELDEINIDSVSRYIIVLHDIPLKPCKSWQMKSRMQYLNFGKHIRSIANGVGRMGSTLS